MVISAGLLLRIAAELDRDFDAAACQLHLVEPRQDHAHQEEEAVVVRVELHRAAHLLIRKQVVATRQ